VSAQIRHVGFDEAVGWLKCLRTAFLEDPAVEFGPSQHDWWKSVWQVERVRGAYDQGRCVATLRTFPTTLTVTGGEHSREVPADALTQVTVSGTHRRQGLLRSMLTASLADAKDRGEVVSILRAAEWGIYGRYGYAPASWESDYQVRCRGGASAVPAVLGMTIGQVEPEQSLGPMAEAYSAMRAGRPGHIERDDALARRRLGIGGLRTPMGREPVHAVAWHADGSVAGVAAWSAKDSVEWTDAEQDIVVHDLVAASRLGYQALWSYLTNLDLVRSVYFGERATDEPLQWLLADGRMARRTRTGDDLWLRLLDIGAALEGRRWAADGLLVLEVIDEDTGGYGAGRFTLDGGAEHSNCVRTPGATPDITLSQRALAALYLGGNTVSSQRVAGLIEEHTSGACAVLARMLACDAAPWNATAF
jgi:predicted acetyltransferase